MLFNSFEFLFFLPIVFLFYWFVFKRLKWQNLFSGNCQLRVLWLVGLAFFDTYRPYHVF